MSSASGDYVFSLLKPGQYNLTVTKDGFKTSTRTIDVLLGTTVSGNVALELGAGTTTVEVSADNFKRKTQISLPTLKPNKLWTTSQGDTKRQGGLNEVV